MYDELLERLQNKRTEFEIKLNAEKQKWQVALSKKNSKEKWWK